MIESDLELLPQSPTKKMCSPVKKKEPSKVKFKFIPPPEAPVFRPTEEEFEDPLKYINKIRPIAEKTGICKIIPPAHWKPLFVIDRDTFKFTPRIQRINELEGTIRLRLNFIQKLAKHWATQGSPLEIPSIEKTPLDLWNLYHKVEKHGGIGAVNKEKTWINIANELGFTGKGVGAIVKNHYNRIIRPYLLKVESESAEEENSELSITVNSTLKTLNTPSGAYKGSVSKNLRPSFRELRSLEFLGPGPKMAVCSNEVFINKDSMKTRGKKVLYEYDPMAKFICKSCCSDNEEFLVYCSNCSDLYHTYCLLPPLREVPTSNWKCPKCLAANDSSIPLDQDYGFVHSEKEYTLRSFGQMADKFKTSYFKSPLGTISTSEVEQEIWRIMSCLDETTTVEYGADLHTGNVGSGFPTKAGLELAEQVGGSAALDFKKYAESKWNLNNLPVLKESAFCHLTANISGMKVPWVYVGMCFSSFCWHNEDHWTYSINFLHWGEPKTWYGVPGSSAEDFEKAMYDAVPYLFDKDPDLLHQLVTTLNPNVIMKAGVPVYRTDQKINEFVVTFPRAYHAGFNQGYNFAEACNFAPPDWLPIGRNCLSHYSAVRRVCVFSHDELIVKMAENHSDLDDTSLFLVARDLEKMIDIELEKRSLLLEWGVVKCTLVKFDELADELRVCKICKTTCFLSAISCGCADNVIACLEHMKELCKCSPKKKVFMYSYSIDDLTIILQKFISIAEKFEIWCERVTEALLSSNQSKKISFATLIDLLNEAKEKGFVGELTEVLEYVVAKAVKCSGIARTIVSNVLVQKQLDGVSDKNFKGVGNSKITEKDLKDFHNEIETLPCVITEAESVNNVLESFLKFQSSAKKILSAHNPNKRRLESCIKLGQTLNMDSEELRELQAKLSEITWLDKLTDSKENNWPLRLAELKSFVEEAPKNRSPEVEGHYKILQALKFSAEVWQKRVDVAFIAPYVFLEDLETLFSEGQEIAVIIPIQSMLETTIKRVKFWKKKADYIMSGKVILSLQDLTDVINEGKNLPVKLPEISELSTHYAESFAWTENVTERLQKSNSSVSLMHLLWPRLFKDRETYHSYQLDDSLFDETAQDYSLAAYEAACKTEWASLLEVRKNNLEKIANGLPLHCNCGKIIFNNGVQCSLCKTIFLKTCMVGDVDLKRSYMFGLAPALLCEFCRRTTRPNRKVLQELLESARKLTVRTRESVVFIFFMHRVENIVKNVKSLMNLPEIKQTVIQVQKNTERMLVRDPSGTLPSGGSSLYPGAGTPLSTILNITLSDHAFVGLNVIPSWKTVYRNLSIGRLEMIDLRSLMTQVDCLEATLEEVERLKILIQAFTLDFDFQSRGTCNATLSGPSTRREVAGLDLGIGIRKQQQPINVQNQARPIAAKRPVRSVRNKTTRPEEGMDIASVELAKANPGFTQQDIKEYLNEERCASAVCVRPPDEEVDWIQCDDSCKLWFHMRCVHLGRHEISADEEFVCIRCLSSRAEQDIHIPGSSWK